MSLVIKNTDDLLKKDNVKLKMLVYGPSGVGKTAFCGTVPNGVIAACETGHGKGLATLGGTKVAYIEPTSYEEYETFCSGIGFERYDTMVLDGFSYLADSVIRDKALTVPRSQGNSPKRAMGILELDDYGVLAELERKLLARLLCLDKHILVTCLIDYYQPPSSNPPQREKLGGPELPGSMRAGSAAMFDHVFRLQTRSALKDPRDPKSRYYQRFFTTENDGQYIAKSRFRSGTKAIYPTEVPFDLETGMGTFQWFIDQAVKGSK